MGYIAAEDFAYLIAVLALGALLFGASAAVILVKESAPRGLNAAHRLACKARRALHVNHGTLRSHLTDPTPHSQ